MIDYHANRLALSHFRTFLAGATPSPATADAQRESVESLDAEPGSALLGSFVHHLIAQAASDGAEIDLLERAAGLWARGASLCTELGAIRADLEAALENPADPGAADTFNQAARRGQVFAETAQQLRPDIDAFRADVFRFPHLPPHPRQRDQSTAEWNWSDLTLGRRTDALVRELFRNARDQSETAFAIGAAASYGANATGSAYLGHTVGGPRRSQRHRDRIARNAVGSWLAAHDPGAETPTVMADRISFGPAGSPVLPAGLDTLLNRALRRTFDTGRTAPVPDLQLGYRRLVRHLQLLDAFAQPDSPSVPAQVWMAALYGDPQNPPAQLLPQDVDVVGQDGGGVGVEYGPPGPGPSTPGDADSSSRAGGCGILALLACILVIVVDLIQAFVQCIGQWAAGNTCTFWDNMILEAAWEQDEPDPRDPPHETTDVTAAQLTVLAGTGQAATLVGALFDVHRQVWEALDRAAGFLAVTGLTYPAALTAAPLYAQFTSIPPARSWPHREADDPEGTYHQYPVAALENPSVHPSPFPPGTRPDALFGAAGQAHAAHLSFQLWRQIAAGEQDSQNLDLDADRGWLHPCWAAAGSVQDDPIDVRVLEYDEQ